MPIEVALNAYVLWVNRRGQCAAVRARLMPVAIGLAPASWSRTHRRAGPAGVAQLGTFALLPAVDPRPGPGIAVRSAMNGPSAMASAPCVGMLTVIAIDALLLYRFFSGHRRLGICGSLAQETK